MTPSWRGFIIREKNMNKKTTSIVLGILLVGLVSAGLVPYLSNVVSGSVEVEGPVFYLDGQIDDGIYHKLLVNEIPENEIEINWSDGERIFFKTESLNIEKLYKAKFSAHLWIKTNNQSGNLLQINIIRVNKNKIEDVICSNSTLIISSIKRHKEISCISEEEILMGLEDSLGIEIKGLETSMDDTFWISPGHKYTSSGEDVYNRIEVTAT